MSEAPTQQADEHPWQIIYLDDDCGYCIRHRPYPTSGEYVHEFEVYEFTTATYTDGLTQKEYANDEGASTEFVPDIAKATPIFAGSLKWDGCMDATWPGQDRCMLHWCGLRGMRRTTEMMHEIFVRLGPLIPRGDLKMITGNA